MAGWTIYFRPLIVNATGLRRLLRQHGHGRSIYSETGVWDGSLGVDDKKAIERRWRAEVSKTSTTRSTVDLDRNERCYVLSMFPYPSGNLHMGHVRVYTIGDVIARYHRMNGKTVVHPMGWDAFGLPAENAATERGEDPESWTKKNIVSMKKQLEAFNYSFDWNREFATCDPSYYKWTQFLFLKMFDRGLAYQKEALVNWDPVDLTVLADEQVGSDGRSWRSGALVEKKSLKQWFLKATAFSNELYEGISDSSLLDWPSAVRKVQQHWIGQCVGSHFLFKLESFSTVVNESLSVWTNTPEAIFGAAYIAISPSHNLAKLFSDQDVDCKLDVFAVHPFTNRKLPVFVSNNVAYPENCEAFLGIPSACVEADDFAKRCDLYVTNIYRYDGDERVLVNSDQFTGLTISVARDRICAYAKQLGVGGDLTSSKLRDWLVSRQRYWGTPIPVIHCPMCKVVPVPYKDLPVTLPNLKTDSKGKRIVDDVWAKTTCPKCGGPARREMDTMDTFVDSSWYFLRFLDSNNTKKPFCKEVIDQWMPVDIYIGGMEHAFLHLYYARLISHVWHSLGYTSHKEPFRRLLVQGLVKGQTYRLKGTSRYLRRDQVERLQCGENGEQLVEKESGAPVEISWEKMSKSKHNGVDPEAVLEEYGIDTSRLFILAGVSPATDRNWSSDLFPGVLNWQQKLWDIVTKLRKFRESHWSVRSSVSDQDLSKWNNELFDKRNNCIRRVNYGFHSAYAFNGAISYMQSLTRTLLGVPPAIMCHSSEYETAVSDLIRLLAPMAPHFASELWLGLVTAPNRICRETVMDNNVLEQLWPEVSMNYYLDLDVKDASVEKRSVIRCLKLPRRDMDCLSEDSALRMVYEDDTVAQYLNGRVPFRTTFSLVCGYGAELNLFLPPSSSR